MLSIISLALPLARVTSIFRRKKSGIKVVLISHLPCLRTVIYRPNGNQVMLAKLAIGLSLSSDPQSLARSYLDLWSENFRITRLESLK